MKEKSRIGGSFLFPEAHYVSHAFLVTRMMPRMTNRVGQ